ncbi:MAG: double-strand break repair helicase AddA [Erythrobacter sp.]|uniref:double-strand break repair helicase AddA n=1 Tax=Erythrobacter sp. TaxID=1042 RepID=UPI00261F1E6A|nr:double-strand break repair helicase AddA [Erythrobacter sp.]MDJ0977387.1 double-strand break repair helicase AddA [Erythrobacter sp.]
MSEKVFPLKDNQLRAVEPADNVWLSASAGTGKTQVLSARVLRLLLRRDVEPEQILCLTFTKAGAAEVANRINAVLARWVRLDDTKLFTELQSLGADTDHGTRDRARTLFASVLDCPGGGLRIDTIHAFSQWLLANFPDEADLSPGSQAMDDRQRELLARDCLADLLSEAEASNDTRILSAVELFVLRKDPGSLHDWLIRCAAREELWEGKAGWQSPVDARVRRMLDMPADADEAWAFNGLSAEVFPDATLRAMIAPLEDWGTKTADKCLAFMREWLSLDLEARTSRYAEFRKTLLKADGSPALSLKKPREDHLGFAEGQELIATAVAMVEERLALLKLAELLTAALELGRAFALRWREAKRREGLLDFDDLIRRAAELLAQPETGAWIRYKLDRRFDHILIDEAQDTNAAQWDIVEALIDDFFSGEGASGDKLRTIFTVGDYKQAIFGFQGTSPENYERAKVRIRERILDARENAVALREARNVPNWLPLDLERSFRTAQPVLDFVNAAISRLGHEAFGLPSPPPDHGGEARAGLVAMWNPVRADEDHPEDEEREWLSHHETVLAERIAKQVASWVRGPDRFVLEKGKRRYAEAGDVMVLVRKRGGLAAQIVAKLHEARVAVAGVDRLRLGAPLAVKDVMSALRFAAQPLDDLECANLLVSPLIGWTQDDLLEHAPRPDKTPLWHHLRRKDAPAKVQETAQRLRDLLRLADFETPQALLAWVLTGPWRGRARLVARLGREANDPLDELINAAFAFESANTPSLAGFIEWFDAGSAEVKRDPDDAGGQVRVLTVHGSKGLQAPIVILADATGRPGEGNALELTDAPLGEERGSNPAVPLPALSKDERVGPIGEAEEAASAADKEEHWRLLYVAMTRAEEALFLTGALGKQDLKNGPHEDSWYAQLEPLFEKEALADPLWGARREWGRRADPLAQTTDRAASGEQEAAALPAWATTPIGPEPKPPRPLAPSSAGDDPGADPPLAHADDAAAMRAAMRRGVLIHRLLEGLPDLPPNTRRETASAWLERQGGDLPSETREDMLARALSVLEAPDFAEIFMPGSLAEVPLTATVGGVVVTGTIDRLLVTPDAVMVVDFKTTSRPPDTAETVPTATMRQMAAYVAALEAIYPGRPVRAAVLYTQTPQLIELPQGLLAVHKDQLGEAQESYRDVGPEAY